MGETRCDVVIYDKKYIERVFIPVAGTGPVNPWNFLSDKNVLIVTTKPFKPYQSLC